MSLASKKRDHDKHAAVGMQIVSAKKPYDPKILRIAFEAAVDADCEPGFRAMFGGIMAYVRERPFASLSDVGVALKLPASDRLELLEIPGARPLQYEPNSPPSKSYVLVPDEWFEKPRELRTWVMRAARAALIAPAPKRKRKRT